MNRTSRKVVFSIALAILVYAGIELASFATFRVVNGRWFSFVETARLRRSVQSSATRVADRRVATPISEFQVLHPYLGYVLEPSPLPGGPNRFGFVGPAPAFHGERGDLVAVAIFGGSMAEQLASRAGDVLARGLGATGCFGDRQFEIINLALPGMKQPQQLMTLNYFLSLGADIDLAITLDGFNEIVLPIVENVPQGTFPFYPRSWMFQVAERSNVDLLRKIGAIVVVESNRRELAEAFARWPLRASVTVNWIWLQWDRALEGRIAMRRAALILGKNGNRGAATGYLARGPQRRYASDAERFDDLATHWERSTRIFSNLARSEGIASFHFLQPNQRVPGGKPFGAEERRIALPLVHPYAPPTREGYPRLRAAGIRLRAKGVHFEDLTRIYAGIGEPLYIDDCCHVNDRGSAIMAREIVRVIERDMLNEGSCSLPNEGG